MPNTKLKAPQFLLGGIIVVILAVLLGWLIDAVTAKTHTTPTLLEQYQGTILNKPRPIPPFDLTDNHGKPFDNKSLLGHWTFLFFGFTNCPHICPMTMADLSHVYNNLAQEHISPLPQVVLVSVDPTRDTVAKLNKYVTSFNKDFIGVRGNDTQITQLAKSLGVVYMEVTRKNGTESVADIEHSGTILLVDPRGELHAIFSAPHDPANIAKDFTMIEQRYHT